MSSNLGRLTAAAAPSDLVEDGNSSVAAGVAGGKDERFHVVPVAELSLSYNALNSPEILYLDATNQILLRCINGLTMVFDATFENASPLATYRLNPNARMMYNKHSGVLAIADSKMLCLRRDYAGTFLLKTALKRPWTKNVSVELPSDEAMKFLQIATSDPDSERILKQRPHLLNFISLLRTAVASLSTNSLESVVVEVNGKDLLEQLRPTEIPSDNNNEVPAEWMTFIWPYISILGERIRLMLNPDHPYDFDFAPEWKGLNKEVMSSEAARRLTFERWPHMDYRWALPCQMAEAGFYHQPNRAGEDRVLCFACFLCLVCWEPSDEPWSEHERHSPACRFIQNYTNPNVPMALTMSALSPFAHHLQVTHTSSLVFSSGTSEWIAVASRESAEIHLWRMDSVVQVKQWFTLSSEKFFSAVVDCMAEEFEQPPRRTQRVTWSDDLTNCLIDVGADDDAKLSSVEKGFTTALEDCFLKSTPTALLVDACCETVITALCTVGRPCLIEQSSIGAIAKKSSEQNQTLVVVGVSVNDAELNRVRQQNRSCLETEINTLNTMNKACEFIDVPPRIVGGSRVTDYAISSGSPLRPFLALYQVEKAESSSSRKHASTRQEGAKQTENKVTQSSDVMEETDFSAVLLMDTDNGGLDWSGSAYDEQSGFVDSSNEPIAEGNEVWSGLSKQKYDEKGSDYIPINYEPPPVDISFVQCLRLPAAVDNTSMEISAIVPMQSIFLIVVLNRKEPAQDSVQSAILIYLIHFGKITINIQRSPLKAYYYKDFRIMQFSLANMDLVNASHALLNSDSSTNEYFDGAVIRTADDVVYFINLNTNRLYSLCDEKVAQCTVMDCGKVTLLTRNSGKLITVQVEQSCSHRLDDEEDENATVAGLFTKNNELQELQIPKSVSSEDRELSRNIVVSSNSVANIFASEHLSLSSLRRMWKLTRSDMGGTLRCASYRLPYHFGGQPGYHLTPPPGWGEVAAHQRLRKYFIESMPVEGVSRTWFHQSDYRRSNDVHIFELLHFQHGLRVSHVDICLNFHATCLACPDVELRLYRRKSDFDAVSSFSKIRSQTSLSGNADFKDVETQCDLIAGPYHCADYVDMNSHSATIQLPGSVFLPQPVRKGNSGLGFKSVSYYFMLRAVSDLSLDQTVTALKINERDKLKTTVASGKAKLASKRRIGDSEVTEPSQSSSAANGDSSIEVNRRGVQWIDELVISVVKVKRLIEPNERVEKRVLLETTNLHNSLVMVAAGIIPKMPVTQKIFTVGERLQQQHLSLDIIEWLIDNWVYTSAQRNLLNLAEMIVENVDAIFALCFITSPRTISHKWSTKLLYILRVLEKIDDNVFSKLLHILLSCSTRIVTSLHAVRNAGSLHWLFVLIFALLKMAVMRTNDASCGGLVNSLLDACTNALTAVGFAWKQCWNGSIHEKLVVEYGFSGLPTELVMYDWPASVLSLWPRAVSVSPKLNDSSEPPQHATPFPPPTPTLVTYKWASAAAGYAKGFNDSKPPLNPKLNRFERTSSASSGNLAKDDPDASTYINGLIAEDEMDWMTLFNVSAGSTKETVESITEVPPSRILYPPATGTELAMGRFSTGSVPNTHRGCKYRTLTTSTQLSGLLEAEPLTFTVICASDHIKVENPETGIITQVGAPAAPLSHSGNDGLVPLKIMDISLGTLKKKLEERDGINSTSKTGLHDLSADLNARMTLIAMQQAETKEDAVPGSSEQRSQPTNAGNAEPGAQGCATQGSSASTFGIPTTPKTTPFMTPTPLSPSHLSPINSEPNLAFMVQDETANGAGKPEEQEDRQKNEVNSRIPSLVPVISPDLFKLPSQKVLLMERVTAGSRKFVILDFGVPVFLTDFFIPSVAEIAAVSIDVWLLGESVDGQRILMTTDICRRSIAVQDLQPSMRIRFLKITYIGRQLYNAACRIPLGIFFGHRFFSSWQAYSSPYMQREFLTPFQQKEMTVAVSHLRQLGEDLRCRHQLASAELTRLVDELASEEEVKQMYRECVQLRLQWNIVIGVVHRLELDQLPVHDLDSSLETVLCGSWSDCCPDQLQTFAVELFALLTRATHLIDVRTVALEAFAHDASAAAQSCYPSEAKCARLKGKETLEVCNVPPLTEEIVLQPKFTLDDAVTHFILFCMPSVPKLQVGCITWLFHYGSESDWWPLFFPRVLKEIFSTQIKKHDHKIFLLLSFLCNHSVKSSSKQAAIVLELFSLIRDLAGTALGSGLDGDQSQNRLDVTLLCWSLMLLSSAFDVITYSKKKNDRWAFLGGEYSQGLSSGEKEDSACRWQRKKLPVQSLLKFGSSGGDKFPSNSTSTKNAPAVSLKSQLESLWEKHLKVLEAMKANMKMSEALNAKLQKKIEMEKKILAMSSDAAMNVDPSVFNEMDISQADLPEEMFVTLFPPSGSEEQQIEEISAKKYSYPQDAGSKASGDAVDFGLKRAATTSSKNSSRYTRSRQYNIRLRLPHEPCVNVARKLIRLLCDFEKQLPVLAKLIVCKVVARICISASHHTIPLVCVLEGPIDKLIKIGISEQRTGLLKYAVLHLILDVIEAESRAVAKAAVSRKGQPHVMDRDAKAVEITEELDVLCMRYTGCHFADLAFRAKVKNELAEDLKERKSTGITAAVCCLPEAFCTAKTSRDFSIANYDQEPDLESESLNTLIFQALHSAKQAVVPTGPNESVRSNAFWKKGKEIIKARLANGEQFCYIFRWIDDLLEFDGQAARSCNGDPELYEKIMETTKMSRSIPYEEMTSVSKSAFVACCMELHRCFEAERKKDTLVDGSLPLWPINEAGSSSPSTPGSPMLHGTDAEMKENESKINENDEVVEVMKNIDEFASTVSRDITRVAAHTVESDQLEKQPLRDLSSPVAETPMDTEASSSTAPTFPENRIRRSLEKWMPAKWASKVALNKQFYLEHIMANFLAELRLARTDILVQPCSIVCGDPLSQQLGLNQHVHCMNVDSLADTILRYSVRDLSRWRVYLLSRPRCCDDEMLRTQLGETLNATSAALGRFVQSISHNSSEETVQQLLTFCLDFQAGLSSSTKKLPTVGKCTLPAECVSSIVEFAVTSHSLSDQLWTLVLRVLDLVIKNDPSALSPLIESTHFCKLISKFLIRSIKRVNNSLMTGPATVHAFKSFITRLHETHVMPLRNTLCVKIISVLRDISEQQDNLINFAYPIDCLVELLNIMASCASDYAAVSPQLLSAYISSSIRTARNFILDHRASAGYALMCVDSYLRPNACFQIVQKMPTAAHFGYENNDSPQFPCMSDLWGQYEAQYSKPFDQYSEMRRPATRADPASRFPMLPRRQHQSNTLRQIAYYLDHSSELADHLVSNFPTVIEDLFEIVAACESAVPDVNLISLENWNRITLGDHALSLLLQVSQRVSHHTQRLFEVAVQVLTQYASPSTSALSKPFAFAFVHMLTSRHNQSCFAELGGHLLVAHELERSILSSANDWTAPVSAPLMRQLASLSAQVAGSSDSGSQSLRTPSDVRIDGLYNFAPLCSISSEQSPNVSGQMMSLISVAAPRRARSANWSYHFSEGSGEWFDITLNLPYHIILYEVQIRPHVPTLNTAPAAVQIELCSETSLSQWCNLGAPLCTTGYNKIRISTLSYKLPVIAVRLYFKKPPDSTNLSLSQILLLGMNSTSALSYTCPRNTDFVQWLSIMVQLCNLKHYCLWEYAPELPRAVIALFLGRPLSGLVYCRISQLLYQIDDERAKPNSVVELIFQYIEQGGSVTGESLEWLPDLLFRLCASNPSSLCDAQKEHQNCVIRQCQILLGVTSVVTSQNYKKPLRDVIAVLVWAASCVVWHNLNVEERLCDTLAICMDLAPQLLPFLCEMATDGSEQCNDTLAKSASWLLCSLMRAAPHLLRDALRELGLLDANDMAKTETIAPNSFSVVQRMCQSASAVSQLRSFGLLRHWTELIITYSEEINVEHMPLLVSIVRCLASLCSIEDVVRFLDSTCGSRLFIALIRCVVRCAAASGDVAPSSSKRSIQLEDATINLLSQCVAVGGSHRERIADVLCSLLKNAGGLNGAIQQMVLKCIFDDETVPVKAIDDDTPLCYLSLDIPNRILHPFFGCTRRERFFKVSLYTSVDEMSALFEHKSICDFRQFAKLASDNDDDATRFSSSAYPKEQAPNFLSFTSTGLTVRSGVGLMEMKGSWKIGQLLGDLFTSGRLTSSALKQRIAVDGDIKKAAVKDSADGYYTVALSFSQRLGSSDEALSDERLNIGLTEQTSTLQYFARASGLALLAQHLQLYHPSFTFSTASLSGSVGKPMDQRWLPVGEAVPMTEMIPPNYSSSMFAPPDPTVGEPVYSSLYMPAFGGDADLAAGYEDFEFIDSVAPGEAKGWTYCPVFSQIDNLGSHITRIASQSLNRVPSLGLSPHIIVAFSVFLRLKGYAELLVTYDRKRAKGLLRLAMGVVSPESGAALLMQKQRSRCSLMRTSIMQSQQVKDCENLGSLPFVVLEELFDKYSLDTPDGKSLREAAVIYGVLDILLSCLAHYSHQKHREETIRPPSLEPAPETASLIERLLRSALETEHSQDEIASCGTASEGRLCNFGSVMAPGAASSTAQQHNFWAKGTGFGSGTTQQQWNVDLHVMKRKQDEQNVTHLLRVLTSFIYPRINEFLDAVKNGRADVKECNTVAPLTHLDLEDTGMLSKGLLPLSASDIEDAVPPGPSAQQESPHRVSSQSPWSLSPTVIAMLSRSCLLPAIWAYLRNDSVLDISQHVEVYQAVIEIVAALALSSSSTDGKGDDEIAALLSEPESGCSMQIMLKKLHECISAYLTKLAVESNEARLQNLNIQQTADSNQVASQSREEGLMRLAPIITISCSLLSRRVKETPARLQTYEKIAVTEEEKYIKVMKNLQFETISFFSEGSFIPYHYESSLSSVGTSSSLGKRTRRLAQEIVTLSNSLPLSASSSVFVRASEERLDVMKVLITGPADTPYMNGCFEFDVWFPSDYPNSPMHVNLETTGNHTVRFNPNLYNDGKVCLSVLNTWHGRPEERWNPETSSLLQVIVSVQSLILVAEPYFNEPGYERSKCTLAGQQASRDYGANIRQAVVRWAMLEMLRHPPIAFADVIKKHFWLKRLEILSQISGWVTEMEQLVKQQRGSGRSMQAHLASLKRHAAALEDEFRQMECPEGLEDTASMQTSSEHGNTSERAQQAVVASSEQSQNAQGVSDVVPGNVASLSGMKILKL